MSIPSPKQLLDRFELRPKNSFGQNFLSDVHQAAKIAELGTVGGGGKVLEIGAGLGALTDQLLERRNQVIAVERDRDLVPALGEIFSESITEGRLRVLEEDAKSLDWGEALELNDTNQVPPVLAGNLPYQITGPLIEKTVHLGRKISRAVFLVQKEVADRLAATPKTKTYGALSVFVQAQFRVERAFVIKAGAFYPPPRVDSAVIVLHPHDEEVSAETPAFRQVIKGAFAARRKTLRNAWKSLLPGEQLASVADAASISLDARGETLAVADFARMARLIEEERERSEGQNE